MQEGKAQGIKEGVQQGIQQGQKRIVKRMLDKGILIDEIEELTGISKREIELIKSE